jgi:hypothetical protein
MSIVVYPLPDVQLALPYTRMVTASGLCAFILEKFWTQVGVQELFGIPSILDYGNDQFVKTTQRNMSKTL